MKTIKTLEELLALRAPDGGIEIDGDLRIDCDVPWAAGRQIAYLRAAGNLRAGGNLYAGGYLRAGGNLYAGGNLTVLKYCAILGDLYWSQMSMPEIRGKFFHRMVLPHAWQRGYWEARLDMDFGGRCYESIVAQVLPELPRLLRSRKWSETERWMLGSLKLQDAPVPEWVEVGK